MFKKYLILIFIIFFFNNISYGAGTSDTNQNEPGAPPKTSYYKKAIKNIKKANKLDKKGKIKKAKKSYEVALRYLYKSNKQKPSQANTLNYLGYTLRKLGDFEKAEIYYLLGLEIEPNHNGINEYLGELYVKTNRIDKAKERLKVLENCNCKEFEELKNSINLGNSKY